MELKEILQKIEETEALWLKDDLLKLELDYEPLIGVLKGYGARNWSLRESIWWLINVGVVGFRTLYVKDDSLQTLKFANRSTKDLYLILRNYRYDLKLKSLIKELVSLRDADEVCTLWCRNIKRVTWFAKINERDYGQNTRTHGDPSKDGESELSLIDYFNLFNNNKEDAKSADITEKERIPSSDTIEAPLTRNFTWSFR